MSYILRLPECKASHILGKAETIHPTHDSFTLYFINNEIGIRVKSTMQNILLAILCGVLVGTSYIPFYPWALAFAFVALWIAWLNDPRPKKVFFHGWLAQFVYTIIGFHWIAGTAMEFGSLHWSLAYLAVLLFASFANLHLALAGLVWSYVNQRRNLTEFASLLFICIGFFIGEILWPTI